ncbi:YbfB/YjiJ family MFS transporter [Rubrivivax sp. A210]|uniref:YbfB/YjiJ family MFS transporter n=1 Tax=Rubrivivax sp. A210 TaxID=2772301 RepID=UPI001917A712|nr:YbfB/YjiJ family MFS transporter [Rubrivivax sp. A210]CAD5374444.1 YbfB/YjiJ family MFS transporter [Rubrivivax sp. A210]
MRAPGAQPAHSAGPDRAAFAIAAMGLVGLASAMGIGRFAFTPLLPLMLQDGQLTLAQGAWLASVNYLGYLLGALAAARWPIAPATAARGGLVGVALFTLAMGASSSFGLWMAWRLLAGMASALVLVGISGWALQALAAAGRPAWAGLVFAGVGSGIALAGLVGLGAALGQQPPGLAWLLLGTLAAVAAGLGWRHIVAGPALPTPAAAATAAAAGGVARHWRVIVAYGSFGYGYILPATFLPAMARQQFADPAFFGSVWPLFGLAAAASTLLAARVARGLAPHVLWIASQLLMAAGVLAPALSPSLAALLISALCVGGTFMVLTMAAMQQARLDAGAATPRLIAVMTAAFAAGQLVGPLTLGPLSGGAAGPRNGVPLAASLVAAAVLVAGAALLQPRSTST